MVNSPRTGLGVFYKRGDSALRSARSTASEGEIDPKQIVRDFLASQGATFGFSNGIEATVRMVSESDSVGMTHVRVQQSMAGIPVRGGELTLHLRGGEVVSVLASTLPVPSHLNLVPNIDRTEATAIGWALLGSLQLSIGGMSEPALEIVNPAHLGAVANVTRLAWFLKAAGGHDAQHIWIDAHSGELLFHFDPRPDALARTIYNANATNAIPGTLARSEGEGPVGQVDVDRAYDYLGDSYDYFLNEHGRDSWDGEGAPLLTTVRSCPDWCGCPCLNATFDENLNHIFIGANVVMDDIMVHEVTHGVVLATAGLIYFGESGALNESYADIFGETVDLTNGSENAGDSRWWLFDDIFGGGFGVRNMMDPALGLAGPSPAKLSDPIFHCSLDDSGGVHINSGIANHAYALMVDGGNFNAVDIVGIGLEKAAQIHYRALTVYLTSTSGFLHNDSALRQSCSDLIGTSGIAQADCDEVGNALDAVEMSAPSPCTSLCPAEPRGTCEAPAPGSVSTLLIKDNPTKDEKDKLVWKMIGPPATAGERGDPVGGGSSYALCAYDQSGPGETANLILETVAPSGGAPCEGEPCWKALKNGGYKYKNKSTLPFGTKTALVKPVKGGKTRLVMTGSGSALGVSSLDAISGPVTVEFQNTAGFDGPCWSVTYDAPLKQDAGIFKAKAKN